MEKEHHRIKIAFVLMHIHLAPSNLADEFLRFHPRLLLLFSRGGIQCTLQGTNISHLWKRKIIDSKLPFQGILLASGSVIKMAKKSGHRKRPAMFPGPRGVVDDCHGSPF